MKFLVSIFLAVVTLCAVNVHAYRFETGFDAVSASFDSEVIDPVNGYLESEQDYDEQIFRADVYFQDVQIGKGPWSEAAFLDKASYVSLRFDDEETDEDLGAGSQSLFDWESTEIFARGVFDIFIVELNFENEDRNTGDEDSTGVGAGVYIKDNQEVVVSFEAREVHGTTSQPGITRLRYKGVFELWNSQSLVLGSNYQRTDFDQLNDERSKLLGLDLTYYLNPKLGLLVSGRSDVTNMSTAPEIKTYEYAAGVSYFVVEQLKLEAYVFSLSTEGDFANGGGAELLGDAFQVALTGRF